MFERQSPPSPVQALAERFGPSRGVALHDPNTDSSSRLRTITISSGSVHGFFLSVISTPLTASYPTPSGRPQHFLHAELQGIGRGARDGPWYVYAAMGRER